MNNPDGTTEPQTAPMISETPIEDSIKSAILPKATFIKNSTEIDEKNKTASFVENLENLDFESNEQLGQFAQSMLS